MSSSLLASARAGGLHFFSNRRSVVYCTFQAVFSNQVVVVPSRSSKNDQRQQQHRCCLLLLLLCSRMGPKSITTTTKGGARHLRIKLKSWHLSHTRLNWLQIMIIWYGHQRFCYFITGLGRVTNVSIKYRANVYWTRWVMAGYVCHIWKEFWSNVLCTAGAQARV